MLLIMSLIWGATLIVGVVLAITAATSSVQDDGRSPRPWRAH